LVSAGPETGYGSSVIHETALFPPGFHAMSSSVALTLNPVPGFCVKSNTLQPAVVHRTATSHPPSAPSDTLGAVSNTIPKGLKVFVNIAWDTNVPPPPLGSEDAIQKAMHGRDYDESNSDEWFIPVLVSDLRNDKDKGRCCPPPVSEHFAQASMHHSWLKFPLFPCDQRALYCCLQPGNRLSSLIVSSTHPSSLAP
jgi:hypothetical protein